MIKHIVKPTLLCCIIGTMCSFDELDPNKDVEGQLKNDPYDAVIVPGVPYHYTSMQSVLKARVLWAKYLYDNKFTKNLIFSGSSVYSPYIEGEIMRIYADSLGIPACHTFAETEAEHSTENIYYSLLMAKQLGFKKIGVATDKYQAAIIGKFIKQKCPQVEIVIIEYDKIDLPNAEWPLIDATPAYVNSFVSLSKRENLIKRFKGTLGRNIPAEDDESYTPPLISFKGIGKIATIASGMVGSLYRSYASR